MLQSYNIDRNDARINTCAPFKYGCRLRLGDFTIPPSAFLSIKLQCHENITPPVRLAEVQANKNGAGTYDSCTVTFRDVSGSLVGSWTPLLRSNIRKPDWPYVLQLIRDEYDVVIGHVAFHPSIVAQLLEAAKSSMGTCTTSKDDFILLPQCHDAWLLGNCKSISLADGSATTGTYNMEVKFGPLIHAEMDPQTEYSVDTTEVTEAYRSLHVSIVDVYENRTLDNGICELIAPCITVNGIAPDVAHKDQDGYVHLWVGGKHLSLRSSITSNIRVVRTDRGITLTGISDV